MTRSLRPLHVLVISSIGIAACTGGGHTHKEPIAPAPTNVVATAGYHSVHLTWDAVAGVNQYAIFASDVSNAPRDTLTPVFATGTSTDVTGLANWKTWYFRVVSSSATASNGPMSAEVSALPVAGFVVAFTETPGSEVARVIHSDDGMEPVPPISVTGGRRIPPLDTSDLEHFEPPELIDAGLTLYRIPENPVNVFGDVEIGMISPTGVTTLAAQAGHHYQFAGFIPGADRILIRDESGAGSAYALLSFAKDGGDMRTLESNCTTMSTDPLYFFANANGVLYECDNGLHLSYSDGVSAAIQLSTATSGAPRPLYIAGGRAIASDASSGYITTQELVNMGATPTPIIGTVGSNFWLYAVSGNRMLVLANNAGTYRTYAVDADGGNVQQRCSPTSNIHDFSGFAPDGAHFLLAQLDSTQNRVCESNITYNVNDERLFLPVGTTAKATQGWYFADGSILLAPETAGSFETINKAGAATLVTPLGAPYNSSFEGIFGDRAILRDPNGTKALKSFKEDNSTFVTLTPSFSNETSFQLVPTIGRLTYTDDAGMPWIATPDGSFNAQLDTANSTYVRFEGNSGPSLGNRDFYVITRPSGPSQVDTVSWDVDGHTLSDLLTGATSDFGVWDP